MVLQARIKAIDCQLKNLARRLDEAQEMFSNWKATIRLNSYEPEADLFQDKFRVERKPGVAISTERRNAYRQHFQNVFQQSLRCSPLDNCGDNTSGADVLTKKQVRKLLLRLLEQINLSQIKTLRNELEVHHGRAAKILDILQEFVENDVAIPNQNERTDSKPEQAANFTNLCHDHVAYIYHIHSRIRSAEAEDFAGEASRKNLFTLEKKQIELLTREVKQYEHKTGILLQLKKQLQRDKDRLLERNKQNNDLKKKYLPENEKKVLVTQLKNLDVNYRNLHKRQVTEIKQLSNEKKLLLEKCKGLFEKLEKVTKENEQVLKENKQHMQQIKKVITENKELLNKIKQDSKDNKKGFEEKEEMSGYIKHLERKNTDMRRKCDGLYRQTLDQCNRLQQLEQLAVPRGNNLVLELERSHLDVCRQKDQQIDVFGKLIKYLYGRIDALTERSDTTSVTEL